MLTSSGFSHLSRYNFLPFWNATVSMPFRFIPSGFMTVLMLSLTQPVLIVFPSASLLWKSCLAVSSDAIRTKWPDHLMQFFRIMDLIEVIPENKNHRTSMSTLKKPIKVKMRGNYDYWNRPNDWNTIGTKHVTLHKRTLVTVIVFADAFQCPYFHIFLQSFRPKRKNVVAGTIYS